MPWVLYRALWFEVAHPDADLDARPEEPTQQVRRRIDEVRATDRQRMSSKAEIRAFFGGEGTAIVVGE